MRKLLLYIIFLFFTHNTFSQTPALNAAKYEAYRNRLLQEFIIGVGSGTGMSIPAAIRDTVTGVISWGDATIDLAYYIGVLATEYHLKTTNGTNADTTIKELFYALDAINRLDYTAEIYFGSAPSLNGFFIRDDVTPDSLNITQVLNHLNQNSPAPVITQLVSDLSSVDPFLKEMSLDQVIHLLAGLSLVVSFVSDTTSYYENNSIKEFYDFETSIKLEAKNVMKRLVNYMKEGDFIQVNLSSSDTNLIGIQGLDWDFIIKNPVTGMQVARGHNAQGLSIGYVGAKYRFTGEDSFTNQQSLFQQSQSVFIWLQDNILTNNQDDKALLLNSLCNCWPNADYTNTTTFDYNAQKIGVRAYEQSYDYIPLLHHVLFQQPNYSLSMLPLSHPFYNNPAAYYTALIDSAPMGSPFNYGNGNYPHYEWSSTSRNIHPLRRGDTIPDFPGHYNGLDFMFFYNLQQISNNIVISIEEKDAASKKTIFPNPCNHQIKIPVTPKLNSDIKIYTPQGRLVKNIENVYRDYLLNCAGLIPGFYFITVTDASNINTYKIIIN